MMLMIKNPTQLSYFLTANQCWKDMVIYVSSVVCTQKCQQLSMAFLAVCYHYIIYYAIFEMLKNVF